MEPPFFRTKTNSSYFPEELFDGSTARNRTVFNFSVSKSKPA
jgi:hypothetical protein